MKTPDAPHPAVRKRGLVRNRTLNRIVLDPFAPPGNRSPAKPKGSENSRFLDLASKPNELAHRPEEPTGSLVIIGTGIKAVAQITLETQAWIKAAEKVLYCVADPVTERWIRKLNRSSESLFGFYGDSKPRLETYNEMIQRILRCVREGKRVCVAFYGHPGVFVYPSREAIRLARSEGFPANMMPGISAEDCLFADLGIDPSKSGCQMFEATDWLVRQRPVDTSVPLILWQIACVGDLGYKLAGYDCRNVPVVVEVLQSHYGLEHEVILYEAAQYAVCDPIIRCVPLAQLMTAGITGISTLYVPPKKDAPFDVKMLRRLGLTSRLQPTPAAR
jgi:uncharacterized protein YabN with tetrapyrrole methylase and pyrophosphatase domain